MKQVKIIADYDIMRVEKGINDFLRGQEGKIEVIDFEYISDHGFKQGLILYEIIEQPDPEQLNKLQV